MSSKQKKSGSTRVKRPKRTVRHFNDGYYEVTPAFPDDKSIAGKIGEHRYIIAGSVHNMMVVHVARGTPREHRDLLGETLAKQGVTALILPEDIRFMKIRRLSAQEEMTIRAQVEAQVAARRATPTDGGEPHGDGSLADGTSDGGALADGEGAAHDAPALEDDGGTTPE